MAATNYTPIQLYHSTTASAVPVNTNLVDGELAINIADGKLYYKDSGGTVQVIASKATGTIGGSTTQVQYNSSGALAGSANFTFNGTTATINTLNLTNALGAAYGGTAQSTYTQGDLLYASAANTLSKLAIGSNTYILTSNGTIPGWAAPSSISVNTATNLAGGAGGSVPYQSGAGATTFLSIGTANQVMTSSGSLPQWSSGLSITTLTASDAVTFSATTQNIALGTSQTTGTFTVGGAAQTGTQTFDQSTKTHTLNLGTGATESGLTKTINLGTGGVSTSTTAITVGSANGTTTTLNGTVTAATLNSTTIDTTNIEVTNIKAKDGTAALSIADSTGVVSVSANPVLSGGTANGVAYLNASKALTTGSALTFDGTNFATTGTITSGGSYNFNTTAGRDILWGTGSYTYITGNPGTGVMAFGIANSEQMRLTSTGLGIGTSSPGYKLDVNGGVHAIVANGTAAFLQSNASGSYTSLSLGRTSQEIFISIAGVANNFITGSAAGDLTINNNTGNVLITAGGSATQLYLNTSGNLGLGVTPSAWTTGWKAFQIASTSSLTDFSNQSSYWNNCVVTGATNPIYQTTAAASFYRQTIGQHLWYNAPSGTAGNAISFTQAMTLDASGNLGVGSTTINVGSYGRVITVAAIAAAYGAVEVSGTTGGAIDFQTSQSTRQVQLLGNSNGFVMLTNGGSGLSERARITSGGDFRVTWNNGSFAGFYFDSTYYQGLTNGATNRELYIDNRSNDTRADIVFRTGLNTAVTERARITSGGDFLITTNTFPSGSVGGFGFNASQYAYFSRSGGETLNLDRFTSEGAVAKIRYAGTEVGSISVTASATAYNTSSDYRLKDNPQPLTNSGAFIDALQPKTWNWKETGKKGVGFIAHEVQTVSPGSVVGEKDAVDADGNPIMQAMEYGSAEFIANIIAELQSLRARVAQLEGK